MYGDVYGGLKRMTGPLKLELQVFVSCLNGCGELYLRSSAISKHSCVSLNENGLIGT